MNRPFAFRRTLTNIYKIGLMILSALLIACQSPREALQQLAEEHGRQLEVLPGHPFPLVMLAPLMKGKPARLRVYLEGDGHAWATATQPSLDPSPHNLLVPRLAVNDPTPNAYLARPCQFVLATTCQSALWTNRRFSQEVVTSLSLALDHLKRRNGNREFEIVGYSGGAALALLLAAQRDDITQVQTIAGNLSPGLWATMKGLSPLDGSLDPLDYRNRLVSLPQRHLIGEADSVIPGRLAEVYQQALGSPLSQYISVPAVSHDTGWETTWSRWVNTPFANESNNIKDNRADLKISD